MHQRDIDELKIDIGLALEIGADRHEIVRTAHLYAMAGVIEQPDIGALDLPAETLHRIVDFGLVEIELRAVADQIEAKRAQGIRHQRGVVDGVFQPRDILVGRIADDERDALVRLRRRGEPSET